MKRKENGGMKKVSEMSDAAVKVYEDEGRFYRPAVLLVRFAKEGQPVTNESGRSNLREHIIPAMIPFALDEETGSIWGHEDEQEYTRGLAEALLDGYGGEPATVHEIMEVCNYNVWEGFPENAEGELLYCSDAFRKDFAEWYGWDPMEQKM